MLSLSLEVFFEGVECSNLNPTPALGTVHIRQAEASSAKRPAASFAVDELHRPGLRVFRETDAGHLVTGLRDLQQELCPAFAHPTA